MNIMKFFGFDNDEDDYDDNDDYTEDRRKKSRGSRAASNGAAPAGKLIVYNYNSETLHTDKIHLRDEFINNGAMILVDLHELNQREFEEAGKEFITFMGGLAYAHEGEGRFIEPAQYLFTPRAGMFEIWPEERESE